MEDTFHIYLSSKDSEEAYPENSSRDFTVKLPQRIQLSKGKWWCGLISMQLPGKPSKPAFVCSDICDESVTGDYKLPVLARVRSTATEVNNISFVPVKKRDLNSIRIYLKKSQHELAPLSSGQSYCVLQFRKDEALPTYS
jgi:hypothetical protein